MILFKEPRLTNPIPLQILISIQFFLIILSILKDIHQFLNSSKSFKQKSQSKSKIIAIRNILVPDLIQNIESFLSTHQ